MIEKIHVRPGGDAVVELNKFSVLTGKCGVGKSHLLRLVQMSAARERFGSEQRRWKRSDAEWTMEGDVPTSDRIAFINASMMMRGLDASFARQAMQIDGWRQAIATHLAAVFPSLAEAGVEIGETEGDIAPAFLVLPGQGAVPVRDLGDGVHAAFVVLAMTTALAIVAKRSRQEAIILWDDAGTFLDPVAIDRMLDIFYDLVSNAPMQALLATHSIDVLAWLADRAHSQRIDPGLTSIVTLIAHGDGSVFCITRKEAAQARWFFSEPRLWYADDSSLTRIVNRDPY